MKTKLPKNFVVSAICLIVAIVLPFWTGQIPEIGSMMCPMHIPVLLCGYYCGSLWGMGTGAVAALLRSLMFGMPQFFPQAVCMAFELAAYGFAMGFLREKWEEVKLGIFAMLLGSMAVGRVVWGLAMFICTGFNPAKFGFEDFFAEAITNAVPGIVVQFALIPIFIMVVNNMKKGNE